MRARSIKPGIFKNEHLAVADPLYSIIFEGLWCLADREGRLEDRPAKIHMEINPGRPFDGTERSLAWLAEKGFIQRYSVQDKAYILVIEFTKHQKPHQNEKPSEIPPPPSAAKVESTCDQGAKHLALNPSSLNPDSGILTPDCGLRTFVQERTRASEPVPRETPTQPRTESTWEAHRQWFLDELRPVYPSNLHTDADWELAARPMAGKLESGETTRADLHRLTLEFAAQQDAKGNRNTQWVENPVRHFDGRGKWRGPFALPSAPEKVDPRKVERQRQQAAESQQLTDLRDRATRIGFRGPHEGEPVAAYETAVRMAERDHAPVDVRPVTALVGGLVAAKRIGRGA